MLTAGTYQAIALPGNYAIECFIHAAAVVGVDGEGREIVAEPP